MNTKTDTKPVSKRAKQRFGIGFYYSLAAALFVLGGFTGRSPADNPVFCGVAFVFAFVGLCLSKTISARLIGVLLVGVSGGFLASFIRTQYF